MNQELVDKVDRYIIELFAKNDAVLDDVVRLTAASGIEGMAVSPSQGKMLQLFAKMVNAVHILEIGTLAGYSTIWMARALPDHGKLISLEADAHHAEVAKVNVKHAGLDKLVEIRIGTAMVELEKLVNEKLPPFDMIFIDADKPPYAAYLDYAIRLSRKGTVIVADNVVRNGAVLDASSKDEKVAGVQKVNLAAAADSRITATIIQQVGIKEYDGMLVAVVN